MTPPSLGPLDPILAKSDTRFEEGVLVACRVKELNPKRYAPAIGHPLWSTVRCLEGPPVFYEHPVMQSLTELSTNSHLSSTDLCTRATPYNLTALSCFLRSDDDVRLLGQTSSLPQLNKLSVWLLKPERAQLLAQTPLFQKLSRLEFSLGHHRQPIAGWRDRLAATHLPEVVMHVKDYKNSLLYVRYHFRRGPSGGLSDLTVTFSRMSRYDGWAEVLLNDVAATLNSLPTESVESLSAKPVKPLSKTQFGPEQLAGLNAAIARLSPG